VTAELIATVQASNARLYEVNELDILIADGPLAFEVEHRERIDSHFTAAQTANPSLFNGTMFLFDAVGVEGDRFVARGRKTDFATFLYWRDPGGRGGGLKHCFGVGAIVASDGRVLLGEMGPTTANAGRVYLPSGSLDHHDLYPDGRIHPLDNIHREIGEEVGLDATGFARRPGWWVINHGATFAMCTVFDAPETAAALEARVLAHLSAEAVPELSRIHFLDPSIGVGEINTVPYVPVLLDRLARQLRPVAS